MKVCVVGSGGREHALAHVLARTAEVVVTPGNPGMADPIRVTAQPVEEIEADLVVIGPEAPLVDGLADRLRADGRAVMGPGADGCALGGIEGLHEGDAGGGGRAHGPLRLLRGGRTRRGVGVPAAAARAVGGQDGRVGGRQGRAGGAHHRGGARPM